MMACDRLEAYEALMRKFDGPETDEYNTDEGVNVSIADPRHYTDITLQV